MDPNMTIAHRGSFHWHIVFLLVLLVTALLCGATLADTDRKPSGALLYDDLRIDFKEEGPSDIFVRVVRHGPRSLCLMDTFSPQGWCMEDDIDFLFSHLDSRLAAPFIESALSSRGAIYYSSLTSTVGAVAAYFLEWCRSGRLAPLLTAAADEEDKLQEKARALRTWRCTTSGKECGAQVPDSVLKRRTGRHASSLDLEIEDFGDDLQECVAGVYDYVRAARDRRVDWEEGWYGLAGAPYAEQAAGRWNVGIRWSPAAGFHF